ncbi:MAG: hypothetical protein ACWA5W_03300 [Phycisphaerales bacterium]
MTPMLAATCLIRRFTPDKLVSAVYVMILGLLAIVSCPVHAQPANTTQARLTATQAIEAFTQAQSWTKSWGIPDPDQAHEPDTNGTKLSVAIITLRLDGRVLSRGRAVDLDPSPDLLQAAARQAIAKARARLVDSHDALWEDQKEKLADHITITLELADQLVPIPASELDLPGFGYTPGYLGVAVAKGEAIQAVGPESILTLNTDMTQRAIAIANTLGDQPIESLLTPTQLAEHGYRFYRFEPIVLSQPTPADGAVFLDRGGRVIPSGEVQAATLNTLASKIARHIASRQWPGIESFGVMGTLDPITARCDSNFASPFDQALAASALLRYSNLPNNPNARPARTLGEHLLLELAEIESAEANPWDDPISAAMTIAALSEMNLVDILGHESIATMRTKCLAVLDQSFSPAKGFVESLPPSSHGLIAYALVRSAKIDHQDRSKAAIASIDRTFEQTPVQGLVSQMPFLGWAAIEQGADMQADGWMGQLIAMRALVWDHQLTRNDLSWADRDLEGGIVFTSSSTPLPSWLGTKPLASIATMLADPDLTPGTLTQGKLPVEISHLIDAIRFLNQLSATKEVTHFYASQTLAIGGIRRALWDQHMPIESDAMGLMVLTETIRSIDSISDRHSEKPSE